MTLLQQAQALETKLAADPSSPQANLSHSGPSPFLDTSPGPSSHIGDNSSLISMTRASARDKSQREASEFMSEPPKKDNAVSAHVGRADGLKVSSSAAARAYLQKVAFMATDPEASHEERQKAAALITAVRERAAQKFQEIA